MSNSSDTPFKVLENLYLPTICFPYTQSTMKNIQENILAESIYSVYTFNMITKIAKWGNSLGIRIPKEILDLFILKEDSKVTIKKVDGGILIIPDKKEETLDDLLARVTPENMHPLYLDDAPRGKEMI